MIVPRCDVCELLGRPPAWSTTWIRLQYWMRAAGWAALDGGRCLCPVCNPVFRPSVTKIAPPAPAGQVIEITHADNGDHAIVVRERA